MEECRAEKLLSEYYEEHPNARQYRIDCPICMECVPLDGHFVTTPCCGIYLCSDCSSATLNRDPCDCPFCRAPLRGPDASRNEMLEENIAKGKSWALWQKGNAFFLDGHYEKALKCFHRAYDGGFERSAQMISISYHCLLEEDTCAHDEHKRKALAWARKSAEMGFAIASDGQIIAYLGDDDDKALRWLTISAHIGDANAQSELSQWFSHGKRGVEKSLECALYWSKRASQGKSDDGIFYLGHVVWDLATEWYGGCSGYTGHEARCETFHLFRRAEGLGHSNAMEYIEKLKSGQEKFCSNALCGKEKTTARENVSRLLACGARSNGTAACSASLVTGRLATRTIAALGRTRNRVKSLNLCVKTITRTL